MKLGHEPYLTFGPSVVTGRGAYFPADASAVASALEASALEASVVTLCASCHCLKFDLLVASGAVSGPAAACAGASAATGQTACAPAECCAFDCASARVASVGGTAPVAVRAASAYGLVVNCCSYYLEALNGLAATFVCGCDPPAGLDPTGASFHAPTPAFVAFAACDLAAGEL